MATVVNPNTGRVTASFAAVAKHYGVHVDLCPPRHGNRKGTVEKANHSAAQRWWRTLPDETTIAAAQASLDAFCSRVGDARTRKQDGQSTTVGAVAELEGFTPLPPRFPATLTVERVVTAQALVAFAGNQYSVPPGLAGTTVTVAHRLGQPVLDIVTAGGTVLARHERAVGGPGGGRGGRGDRPAVLGEETARSSRSYSEGMPSAPEVLSTLTPKTTYPDDRYADLAAEALRRPRRHHRDPC